MTASLILDPEVRNLLSEVREWSVAEARPLARSADRNNEFPPRDETNRVLASCPVDFCPMGFEEAFEVHHRNKGWAAHLEKGSNVLGLLVMEEMAYGDGWVWQTLPGGRLSERVIRKIGTPEQIDRWAGGVDRGQYNMTAIALTEQTVGSDIANMKLAAMRDGDSWVLNGTKRFITNGGLADFLLVFATTDPSLGHRGIRAFMVEAGTPGFTVRRKVEPKLGFRFAPQATLDFDNVRLPLDQCLGNPDDGGRDTSVALSEFNATRPFCVAWATGTARASADLALQWVHDNRDEYTASQVQKFEADHTTMHQALDDSRRLILRAAWQRDQGRSNIVESSMAKSTVAPLAERVVLRSLQTVGAEAATERHLLEKWYRDVKMFDIVEGTGQILRMTISRQQLGGGKKS